MSFSQRFGYKPIRDLVQVHSMDDELRTALWNVLLARILPTPFHPLSPCYDDPDFASLLPGIWAELFVRRVDKVPEHMSSAVEEIADWVFTADWYAVYDLLEYLVQNYSDREAAYRLRDEVNTVLSTHLSGWRFVGDTLAPVTNESEIAAIEQSSALSGVLAPVSLHIQYALQNLSDRKNPDYRTSIKESISALESLAKLIAGTPKATLAPALDALETKAPFHGSLKEGFKKLYGWTSDAHGIRHALMDEPDVGSEDAMYMLVSCSAFINYLVAKAQKAGITF